MPTVTNTHTDPRRMCGAIRRAKRVSVACIGHGDVWFCDVTKSAALRAINDMPSRGKNFVEVAEYDDGSVVVDTYTGP